VTVSVVIPTLNEEEPPDVLSSLPHGLREVIVVDGRSPDDTVAVAWSCGPTPR
jgi:glycosyltransferase involved in cell wall biosynthesis